MYLPVYQLCTVDCNKLKYTQFNNLHTLCYENIKFVFTLLVAVNISLWHVFVMQYTDGGSRYLFLSLTLLMISDKSPLTRDGQG